jgi:drug/metabolite transporter (DMT)-like permease
VRLQRDTGAKLASAYAGVAFGLYWIPLRAFEAAGLQGPWATVALNAAAFVCAAGLLVVRRRTFFSNGGRFHLGCAVLGVAFLLYTGAFLFTTIVNVIVFFYLLPLWGFVLARMVIGERITVVRWVSIVLGLGGVLTVTGVDFGIPLPSTGGDWMALAAGFLWALGSLIVLIDERGHAVDYGIGFILWSTALAALAGWGLTQAGAAPPPAPVIDGAVLLWLLAFGLLIVLPGNFATLYGPTVLNPGIVGLFFMTEISVGAVTAAILTDEPFGLRQIVGIVAISAAGVLEPVVDMARRRRNAAA